MLTMWPELLFLSPFAAIFTRVALSTVFALVAYRRFRSRSRTLQLFACLDLVIATALFFGAYMQLMTLFAILCLGAWLVRPQWRPLPQSTNALALIMALNLLITGPGPFAIDLPL